MFRVLPTLGAETAPDIAGDNPDLVLGYFEDLVGQRVADPVRVLHIRIKGIAVLAGIVTADDTARVHELGIDAADHITVGDDARGLGEGCVRRGLVPGFKDVGDIVRAVFPDRCSTKGCLGGVRDRGQIIIVNIDQLGGILRLHQAVRNHQGEGIAHIADPVQGQAGMSAREHRRAVGPLTLHRRRHGAQGVGGDIRTGIYAKNTWRRPCRQNVHGNDPRMGMGRAHDHRMGLASQIDVIDKAALAA